MSSTSPSLFSRLFRYRQTEARTPTEDFLSEALVGFLVRAPAPEALDLILECFIPKSMETQFRLLVDQRKLNFATQVRLPNRKVLDILVKSEGKPVLLIENKVTAAFQMHSKPAHDPDLASGIVDSVEEIAASEAASEQQLVHQLHTYASWLKQKDRPADWPGIVTVLTHGTVFPTGLSVELQNCYGVVTHLCYWRSVHDRLRGLVGADGGDSSIPAWKFVGHEVCRFLESKTMVSSDLTPVEIAAINVSMNATRSAAACFTEIGQILLQNYSSHLTKRRQSHAYDADNSKAWGWTYLLGPCRIFVGYGVFFAPLVGDLAEANPALPDQEHAFVCVGSDEKELNIDQFEVPAGWRLINTGYTVLRPVPLTNRAVKERFPQFIVGLVDKHMSDILSIRAAFESSPNS